VIRILKNSPNHTIQVARGISQVNVRFFFVYQLPIADAKLLNLKVVNKQAFAVLRLTSYVLAT
jgi:hypothetical protein